MSLDAETHQDLQTVVAHLKAGKTAGIMNILKQALKCFYTWKAVKRHEAVMLFTERHQVPSQDVLSSRNPMDFRTQIRKQMALKIGEAMLESGMIDFEVATNQNLSDQFMGPTITTTARAYVIKSDAVHRLP